MVQASARLLRFPTERCKAPALEHIVSLLPDDSGIACECVHYRLPEPDLVALREKGTAIGARMRRLIELPDDEGEAQAKRIAWFAPLRARMLLSITRMRDLEWRAERTGSPDDRRIAFVARYRTWQTGKRLIAAWETLCLPEEDTQPSALILAFQKKAPG